QATVARSESGEPGYSDAHGGAQAGGVEPRGGGRHPVVLVSARGFVDGLKALGKRETARMTPRGRRRVRLTKRDWIPFRRRVGASAACARAFRGDGEPLAINRAQARRSVHAD